MRNKITLTNGWLFYTHNLQWQKDDWIEAKGHWNTPKGREGDLLAPPTSILCIQTEAVDA